WTTVNEPWVIAWLGYGLGLHAPGRTSEADAIAAGHHVLLAHGRALEVLRREVPDAQAGITLDLIPMHPLTGSDADAGASRLEDATRTLWSLAPVLRGPYPDDGLARFGDMLPPGAADDLPLISRHNDFLGINYYRRHLVRAQPESGEPEVVTPEAGEFT